MTKPKLTYLTDNLLLLSYMGSSLLIPKPTPKTIDEAIWELHADHFYRYADEVYET